MFCVLIVLVDWIRLDQFGMVCLACNGGVNEVDVIVVVVVAASGDVYRIIPCYLPFLFVFSRKHRRTDGMPGIYVYRCARHTVFIVCIFNAAAVRLSVFSETISSCLWCKNLRVLLYVRVSALFSSIDIQQIQPCLRWFFILER